jgi:hypothetical protein
MGCVTFRSLCISRIFAHFSFFRETLSLQWTQGTSELEIRHSKGGKVDGKCKGEQDGKVSV